MASYSVTAPTSPFRTATTQHAVPRAVVLARALGKYATRWAVMPVAGGAARMMGPAPRPGDCRRAHSPAGIVAREQKVTCYPARGEALRPPRVDVDAPPGPYGFAAEARSVRGALWAMTGGGLPGTVGRCPGPQPPRLCRLSPSIEQKFPLSIPCLSGTSQGQ